MRVNLATRKAGCHCVLQAWNVRKVCQKAIEHVHATRRATIWRTARGLQLSDIENCVVYIVVCACVCIKQWCKAWFRELLSTWIIVYQQSPQVRMPMTPFLESRAPSKIKHGPTGQISFCALELISSSSIRYHTFSAYVIHLWFLQLDSHKFIHSEIQWCQNRYIFVVV